MSIVRRESFFPFNSSFFDDFMTRDLFDGFEWSSASDTVPKVNIVETDNDFRVEMAAPGMKKEDFHVELKEDMLTIYSEVNNREENERYTRREYTYGSFKRAFYLPNTVESDKIEAKYRDGILSLVIPKKEEARRKPVKTIKIS